MKAHLNKIGSLSILRGKGKESKQQYCYHNKNNRCGDWCPLFDEPIEATNDRTVIQICQSRSLYFTELIDMRE